MQNDNCEKDKQYFRRMTRPDISWPQLLFHEVIKEPILMANVDKAHGSNGRRAIPRGNFYVNDLGYVVI